jgi:transcriptional regulator with XRE-family HTH domain
MDIFMSMPTGKQSEAGPLARAVAAEIRAAMGRHRVSGNQLAAMTGISQNYIAKRLRDEASFTVNDIERICDALGESYLDLWTHAQRHVRGEKENH